MQPGQTVELLLGVSRILNITQDGFAFCSFMTNMEVCD